MTMDPTLIDWSDDSAVDAIDPGQFEAIIITSLAPAMINGPRTPIGRAHLFDTATIITALAESAYRRFGQPGESYGTHSASAKPVSTARLTFSHAPAGRESIYTHTTVPPTESSLANMKSILDIHFMIPSPASD